MSIPNLTLDVDLIFAKKVMWEQMTNDFNHQLASLNRLEKYPSRLASFFRYFYTHHQTKFQAEYNSLPLSDQLIRKSTAVIFDKVHHYYLSKKLPLSSFLKVTILYYKEDQKCRDLFPSLLHSFEEELQNTVNAPNSKATTDSKCWKKAYELSQLIQKKQQILPHLETFSYDCQIQCHKELRIVNRWELAAVSAYLRSKLLRGTWKQQEETIDIKLSNQAYEALRCFKKNPSLTQDLDYHDLMDLLSHLELLEDPLTKNFQNSCQQALIKKIAHENILEILSYSLSKKNSSLVQECLTFLNVRNPNFFNINWEKKLENLAMKLDRLNMNAKALFNGFNQSIAKLSLSALELSELLPDLPQLKILDLSSCSPRRALELLQRDMDRLLKIAPKLEKLFVNKALLDQLKECDLTQWKNLKTLIIFGELAQEYLIGGNDSLPTIFPQVDLYISLKKGDKTSPWKIKMENDIWIIQQFKATKDEFLFHADIPQEAFEECPGIYQAYKTCISHCQKQPEEGHSEYILGLAYEYGCIVKQDFAEAIKWYQKAVDNKYEDAQENLKQAQEKLLKSQQL